MSSNIKANGGGPLGSLAGVLANLFPKRGAEDDHIEDATHEWNFRIASALLGLKWWRWMAIAMLGVVIVSNVVWGLVTHSLAEEKTAPPKLYVVTVNTKGVPIGDGSEVADGYTPTDAAFEDMIQHYVINAFLVTLDAKPQKNALEYMTMHTTGDASTYMDDYYRRNKPFEIAKRELVQPEYPTINKISDNGYLVTWKENITNFAGQVLQTQEISKTMWVAHGPSIPKNKVGLYVIRILDTVNPDGN